MNPEEQDSYNPLVAAEEEARLLGVCYGNPELFPIAASRVSDQHFAVPKLRDLWQAFRAVFDRTGTLSMTDISRELRAMDSSASLPDLMGYDQAFGTERELQACISVLELCEAKRRMDAAAIAIRAMVRKEDRDTVASVEVAAQGFIYEALRHMGQRELKHLGDAVRAAYGDMQAAAEGKPSRRITTGFSETLDRRLGGGFAPGDMIVLAARTGMGKTALAERIALHVAEKHGSVLYFSPEMSAEALGLRALQIEGPIETERVRDPDPHTLERGGRTVKRIAGLAFYLDDKRSISVPEIVATSKAFRLNHPDMSLLVIDHFGEVALPHGGERNIPRTLGEMASRLRELADELDVPLLLLNQINRGVTKQGDKRPTKSDLRDSGRIEEIADVILLLYRDEDVPDHLENLAELIVDKNRRTGWENTLVIEFLPQFVRFQEATAHQRSAYINWLIEKGRA